MNFRRYITSGAVALLIHNVAFPEPKNDLIVGILSESETHSMTLSFAAPAQNKATTALNNPEPELESIDEEPSIDEPVVAETETTETVETSEPMPAPKEQPLIQEEALLPVAELPTEKHVEEKPEKVEQPKPVPEPKPEVEPEQEKAQETPEVEPEQEKTQETPEALPEEIEDATEEQEASDIEVLSDQIEQDNNDINLAQSSPARLIEKPTFSTKPGPVNYPRQARRRGMQGTVWLEVELNADASIDNVNIIESSGHDVLDQVAITDVSKWAFSPFIEQGIAIAYRVRIPVRFKLN